MHKLPRNIICAALFEALWKDGFDGEELILGFLGALRDVAAKECGTLEINRLAKCFADDVVYSAVDGEAQEF